MIKVKNCKQVAIEASLLQSKDLYLTIVNCDDVVVMTDIVEASNHDNTFYENKLAEKFPELAEKFPEFKKISEELFPHASQVDITLGIMTIDLYMMERLTSVHVLPHLNTDSSEWGDITVNDAVRLMKAYMNETEVPNVDCILQSYISDVIDDYINRLININYVDDEEDDYITGHEYDEDDEYEHENDEKLVDLKEEIYSILKAHYPNTKDESTIPSAVEGLFDVIESGKSELFPAYDFAFDVFLVDVKDINLESLIESMIKDCMDTDDIPLSKYISHIINILNHDVNPAKERKERIKNALNARLKGDDDE